MRERREVKGGKSGRRLPARGWCSSRWRMWERVGEAEREREAASLISRVVMRREVRVGSEGRKRKSMQGLEKAL